MKPTWPWTLSLSLERANFKWFENQLESPGSISQLIRTLSNRYSTGFQPISLSLVHSNRTYALMFDHCEHQPNSNLSWQTFSFVSRTCTCVCACSFAPSGFRGIYQFLTTLLFTTRWTKHPHDSPLLWNDACPLFGLFDFRLHDPFARSLTLLKFGISFFSGDLSAVSYLSFRIPHFGAFMLAQFLADL